MAVACAIPSSLMKYDVVQPPTVISIPLSRKSISPKRSSTGSRRSFAPCARGKPCACLGAGKATRRVATSAESTMTPSTAPVTVRMPPRINIASVRNTWLK